MTNGMFQQEIRAVTARAYGPDCYGCQQNGAQMMLTFTEVNGRFTDVFLDAKMSDDLYKEIQQRRATPIPPMMNEFDPIEHPRPAAPASGKVSMIALIFVALVIGMAATFSLAQQGGFSGLRGEFLDFWRLR